MMKTALRDNQMIKYFLEGKTAHFYIEGLELSCYFKSIYCYISIYFRETSAKSLLHFLKNCVISEIANISFLYKKNLVFYENIE